MEALDLLRSRSTSGDERAERSRSVRSMAVSMPARSFARFWAEMRRRRSSTSCRSNARIWTAGSSGDTCGIESHATDTVSRSTKDVVDPTTLTRQSGGSLSLTGVAKVSLAKMLIEDAAPYCNVQATSGIVENLWDPVDDPASTRAAVEMRRTLATADLVIDATANPPVTRLLDRIRASVGKPLLVVSGTAGGWGGVVTMLTPDTGCWACVEHHRIDHSLPLPPADPDGWVTPTRCAQVTFTGARHQMQQIALHASAVAIGQLVGAPMGGD